MIALKVIMKPQEIPNWKETPDTIHLKVLKLCGNLIPSLKSYENMVCNTKNKGYIKINEEVYKLKR